MNENTNNNFDLISQVEAPKCIGIIPSTLKKCTNTPMEGELVCGMHVTAKATVLDLMDNGKATMKFYRTMLEEEQKSRRELQNKADQNAGLLEQVAKLKEAKAKLESEVREAKDVLRTREVQVKALQKIDHNKEAIMPAKNDGPFKHVEGTKYPTISQADYMNNLVEGNSIPESWVARAVQMQESGELDNYEKVSEVIKAFRNANNMRPNVTKTFPTVKQITYIDALFSKKNLYGKEGEFKDRLFKLAMERRGWSNAEVQVVIEALKSLPNKA